MNTPNNFVLKHPKNITIVKIEKTMVTFKCNLCGNVKSDYYARMKNRFSCGCVKWYTHGMRNTRFYGIWKGIQGRCYCKTNKAYIGYGSVGITSAWKDDFNSFKNDMYESYLKHVEKYGEKNTSIDRIDNSKNYSKENCRWATNKEQARNKTNTMMYKIKGKNYSVRFLAEKYGIVYETLRYRILNKHSKKTILKPPVPSQEFNYEN